MLISVLVPSYRRPLELDRCLLALSRQSRFPDRVVVVIRHGDEQTRAVLRSWEGNLPLCLVTVTVPGVVQAMNAGLEYCLGDVVAITDDDAAPWPQWLQRIEDHFSSNSEIGAVGGRDWVHENGVVVQGQKAVVGKVLWFGRFVGDHHQGVGPARDVDILKGANCAFRLTAIKPIGFEQRLKGSGAQVHWELCLCFAIKRAGWRIIYDPAICVDHFPAPRFDRDKRNTFDPVATADRTYNLRLALLNVVPPWKRYAALFWFYLVGTPAEPGFVNFLRMLLRRDPNAFRKFWAAHGFGVGLI